MGLLSEDVLQPVDVLNRSPLHITRCHYPARLACDTLSDMQTIVTPTLFAHVCYVHYDVASIHKRVQTSLL
jgi:hypothetical protein